MAQPVVWSRRALQDVEAIAEYIVQDSPACAAAAAKRIITQRRVLSRFPRSGRKVPEFDEESIPELFAYNYRIIYVVQAEEVLIAAVIHGKTSIARCAVLIAVGGQRRSGNETSRPHVP